MSDGTYVMLAPIRLKQGIDEAKLVEASDVFEKKFVKRQEGIVKRMLLRTKDGAYADLVFFESRAAADRVVEAESSSEECNAFFSIMQPPDESLPDMGVLSFEHVKTYE
jgi:hypothetical protein